MNRFDVFDHERPLTVVRDGDSIVRVSDRTVVRELTTIEPLDERHDTFVSVPVRSVITSGAGPSIEIGPFSLTAHDIAALHNALFDHIAAFPADYKVREDS